MNHFDHEKLDVYHLAIELIVLIEKIVGCFPKGRAYLIDQLQRAGTSVLLNTAEGAGEFSRSEKNRFYRMAKRSATECAGIFDVCLYIHVVSEIEYAKGRALLLRIVSMLVKMAKSAG